MKKTAIILISLMCLFLSGCQMNDTQLDEGISGNSSEAEDREKIPAENASTAKLPMFLADSIEAMEAAKDFKISSYYCTDHTTASNHYVIDENQVLWGYGHNEFGQLGNGQTDTVETIYTDPVKIAENVVSVDASCNGYFAIYLTEDGKLYGMGSNRLGLLGQPYEMRYSDFDYNKVTEPVLLMQDVVYASAGMYSIAALKQDGTVWWWGEYSSTYLTKANASFADYWKSEEDEQNPVKMLYNSPKMILEDCIYAVTGNWHGAAITSDGELYTWGLNIYGDCGVEVGKDDYVRRPVKVLDDVNMVWVERMDSRGMGQGIYDTRVRTTRYDFNVFAQLNDGTMMAAGKDLGNKEKTIELTGDIETPSTDTYADIFLPIAVEEYSEKSCRAKLKELQWGMTMSEVEKILSQGNMKYFETSFSEDGTVEQVEASICVNDSDYLLFFDENKCLYQIRLQAGGSRSGQFSFGMTLEEVQALLDCELVYEPDVYEASEVYFASEPIDGTYFAFVFNDVEGLMIVIETEEGKADIPMQETPTTIRVFTPEDVKVTPEIVEYNFKSACEKGEKQEIYGMLPGASEGTWYIVAVDGVEYYYGRYDFSVDRTELFGYAIVSEEHSLANGISVGMTKSEVIERYPAMAMLDMEGNILNEVTGHMGWNSTAYPCSPAGMDEKLKYVGGKEYRWEDQFDYVMIADVEQPLEALPVYVALMMKDDIVSAVTFYYPTAG